jgi:regulator of protease activity HflC (stomatin/prohibitin superfamily)
MKHFLVYPLVGLLLLGGSGCMARSTGPTEVGVRTVKWSLSGNRGVQDEIYPAGSTYFFTPFTSDWHTFDTRLQNLEMTMEASSADREGNDDLLFKTVDGNDISLDVIISYRILPDKAPFILQNVAADDTTLRENIVRTIARSTPRDIFGELDTEEFYIAEKRSEKAEEVVVQLNTMLEPYGVIVERVGTRDYRFNPEYQQAIADKKLADQQAEKLKAETHAKEAQFLTEVEIAKAETEKTKARADGEYSKAVIAADAYFEQQSRFAEAIIAEGKAEAEGIRAMNKALAGSGGAAMVKLHIADALQGKRIVMLPIGAGGLDLRTMDMNQFLATQGLQKLGEQAAKPKPAAGQKKATTEGTPAPARAGQ